MQRFFLTNPDIQQDVLEIRDPRVVYQANKVLRMKTGSKFSVFDESGNEQVVQVIELNKRKILANVIEPVSRSTESKLNVALYQSIPKKPALFELIVQKATEIGVSEIYPLITNRTEKRRIGKFERLQMIAIEATEQSRRTKVPTIHHPVNFSDLIPSLENGYLGYEYEDKNPLASCLPAIQSVDSISIVIGPEGGFDQEEIELAKENELKFFTLGPRILRTETAAISSLSIVLLS